MELCQGHNEWAVSITSMLLGKEWRLHRLKPQSSLSIWVEERVGGLEEVKRRPQGQIKSTHTGYRVPKPSVILSEGLCHSKSRVSSIYP